MQPVICNRSSASIQNNQSYASYLEEGSILSHFLMMENEKVIAVFDMLCDRLGKIENGVSKITEHLKENQRTKLGRIDSNLFGWSFAVNRKADVIQTDDGDETSIAPHFKPESEGSRLIQAAYVSYPAGDRSIPPRYYEGIIQDELPIELQECLHGIDVQTLVRLEKDLDEAGEGNAIKCCQVGLKSQYTYVGDEITQRMLAKHQDKRVLGIRHFESYGVWIWTAYPGYAIDDLINIVNKAFGELGIHLDSQHTIFVYPIIPAVAEVASFFNEDFECRDNLDRVAMQHAVKEMFRIDHYDEYLDSHEMTSDMSEEIKELVARPP